MNDKPFSEPIRLKLGQAERVVRSAWEGLECLADWPAERDRHYRSALRACRDALDGLATPTRAHLALKEAARAAQVSLEH